MVKRYGLGVLIWGAFLIWNHAHATQWNEPKPLSVRLITLMLTYSAPTTLNAWACDTVYKLKPDIDGGCYDICWGMMGENENLDGETHELQNACGLVVYGGEY